ncbi:hypothetical protein PV10_01645 [Exophiala mesophila]|uniref:Uncharacterized protein n=1 Tax=Exophiala mesophila TaxID=212818 RepID=A0A0D1X7U9_EXOME|nr:uncharacterized protein PV10_01645 [Exophiala mesophila]KIV97950.1 hypothetical protein PV10_01645 [Exophiala mesophila]
MSSGLPYLQKLRKSDLTEFAESSKLADYAGLKKAELEVALDEHLRANSTTYGKDPSLSEYYKRLASSTRSPTKKIAEKVSELVKSDDDAAPVKKPKRKTTSAPVEDTTDTDSPTGALIKAPAKEVARRGSILTSQIPLPPSPSVVTDAIEQQTRRFRTSVSHAYQRTQIHEYADMTRDLLSSPLTVTILGLLLEANALRTQILPNQPIAEFPAVPYVLSKPTAINVPNLFLLLETKFWAPFSLWFLTSAILPAIISYFINLPLKAQPTHSYSTRRATTEASSQLQFDPFIFNIAKGLLAYLIYPQPHAVTYAGLYEHHTIATVNESILGGYFAVLISAGIGAIVSLYDAVLKK